MRLISSKSLKLLRLTTYLTFVFLIVSLFATRALYAQVKGAALALGHELAGLSDLSAGGHTISLNGARLHYARVISKQPLDEALDRLEAYCAAKKGLLGEELERIQASHPREFEEHFPEGGLRRGVVQHRSEEAGVVLCLARPPQASDGLVAALRKFIATSDLSELGHVRYAVAEKLASGETRVIVFWNNGPLDLRAMFPATGDAAGSDSLVLPRPPKSRRTLSAAVEGMPYALRTYASSQSVESLKQFYGAWMQQRQWAFGAEAEGTTTYFRSDGYQAFVSLLVQDGMTFVTLTEAGRTGAPSIERLEVSR